MSSFLFCRVVLDPQQRNAEVTGKREREKENKITE